MDLLSKFGDVSVDNSSRIDSDLYQKLLKRQIECDEEKIQVDKRVEYLTNYKDDSNPFKDFIENTKDISEESYRMFVKYAISCIREFYIIDLNDKDFFHMYSDEVYSLENVLDFVFKISEGKSLIDYGNQTLKEDMIWRWNNRWKTPIPEIAKNGTITLPQMVYVTDSHSNYIRTDYNDHKRIDLLERAFGLFLDGENKNFERLNEWVYDGSITSTDKYKKGKVVIQKGGIEHVTMQSSGNLKIVFTEASNGLKFFEYYGLDKCNPKE